MSSQQLNRVERGTVSLRFRPGWEFCEQTGTNPLWLAFGDPYPKSGFFAVPELFEPSAIFGWWKQLSWQEKEEPFLKIMIKSGAAEVYAKHKLQLSETQPEEDLIGRAEREEFKRLAAIEVKHYLAPEMVAPPNWEQLRILLIAKTQSAQAKQELASLLGVQLASISQWRSGANAPSADRRYR